MSDTTKQVLIVAHHYPPHITGVGMVAYNQARHLAALGHLVTVVTSQTNKQEKNTVDKDVTVVRIKALNFSEKWGAPFPLFSPRLLRVLVQQIKKADVVHIHDAFYLSSFFAAVLARWYKKPLVLTQHIALIAHPSWIVVCIEKLTYATTGRIIFSLSDRIIVYNETVRNFLLTRGIPERKIIILPNGVDGVVFHEVTPTQKLALRTALGLSADKKIILFVGRFVYKKGFTKVLAAQNSRYQIVFAGADALQENTPEVVFLGKVLPSKIAEVYQAADIFVLPSESEGFPLSIQEAMSCGLPIITTNDAGYDKYTLDKKRMYLIDNPTDETVRKAIEEIVFDDEWLKEMGHYSKQYADEHFNWNTLIQKLQALYTTLINEKKRKKRIVFVSDAIYHFNKGGKEKRLYDLTTRLVAHGHLVTIYCMKWWQGSNSIEREGVTFYAISPYYPLYFNNRRSIQQAILFSLHCFKLLTEPFDVIDVDHIPHLVLFVAKFVCVIRGKKMIATWHEVWGKKYWQEYLGKTMGTIAYFVEKVSVMLPNTIISVSPHTTADLIHSLDVKKRIVTIPNAVDVELIEQAVHGPSSDIIFAGRLLPHKNVDALLRAVALLKDTYPAIIARIIGEGPQKEDLEALVKELNIQSNIFFVGFIESQSDLYAMMKSSKVFVLPSEREGFGITVIEANAAGLPVVTINAEHNAAKELIINNENGIITSSDPRALADTIETVLRSRRNSDFYVKFAQQYSWKKVITSLEELYI